MLEKIADFYEEEVDTAVAALLTTDGAGVIAFLGGGGRRHRHRDVMPIFELISKLTG